MKKCFKFLDSELVISIMTIFAVNATSKKNMIHIKLWIKSISLREAFSADSVMLKLKRKHCNSFNSSYASVLLSVCRPKDRQGKTVCNGTGDITFSQTVLFKI